MSSQLEIICAGRTNILSLELQIEEAASSVAIADLQYRTHIQLDVFAIPRQYSAIT